MKEREELELILKLIAKYDLPLSPILEYAVREKVEDFPIREDVHVRLSSEPITIENKTIQEELETEGSIILTREIIESARTPNGGFTKSQLAAIGVEWPAPLDWIEEKIGSIISKTQLEKFNHIEYVTSQSIASSKRGEKTYRDVAHGERERKQMEAILSALNHFKRPSTPRDIARTVNRSAWGGFVNEDSVDSILKRLPEVEYVKWGKYILRNKMSVFEKQQNINLLDNSKSLETDNKKQDDNGTVLRVTFPNGYIISDMNHIDLLKATIKKVGIEKVRSIGLFQNTVPLISEYKDLIYGKYQIYIGDGLYLMTTKSTLEVKLLLETISSRLNLGLIIEQIDKKIWMIINRNKH